MTQRSASSPSPHVHPAISSTPPTRQERPLTVLVIAQVVSGAGLAAGITVGALLAPDMLGATTSYATLAILGALLAAAVVPVIAVTSLTRTPTVRSIG